MSNTTTEPSPPHRACSQLMIAGLQDNSLHSVVLTSAGAHAARPADPTEFGDPFARLLLAKGVFPRTAGDVLSSILDAAPPGDPLRTHQFFLVGEDSQIPHVDGIQVPRNLRFLVTCGGGPDGADIFVSSFHPDQGIVEVMAWDHLEAGFNFYRTMPNGTAWVFAGNSRHALTAPTRGNGPFESHRNGHILMKELRTPWVHWHSPFASISSSVLISQGLEDHPWVARLHPGGAYTLEDDHVRPAIARWNRARVEALRAGRALEAPRRLLEQVVETLTVNLMSSRTSSAAAASGAAPSVDLPGTFFADEASLSVLGLATPPQPFSVASGLYASSLRTFDVRLEDGRGFRRIGDTHFAFVIPERAHEDVDLIRQSLTAGIFSRRLLACLVMVDFPNPVFSRRRPRLSGHLPDAPLSDAQTLSRAIADAITGAPEARQDGTPEAEFAELWDVGEQFEDAFNSRLTSYYSAVRARLTGQSGADDYMRLAESRRAMVETMPIAESPLLFATTNIPEADRRMLADGSIEEH